MDGEATTDPTDRIRAAALRLICDVGYGSANVEQIAASAGVGVGSIYRRWSDKSVLANDLLASALDEMEPLFDEPAGPTPEARFATLVVNVWSFATEHPEEFLLVEDHIEAPFVSAENLARKTRLGDRAGELLRSLGVSADPGFVGALVLGTFVSLLRHGQRPDPDELAQRLWRALQS